MADGSLPIVVTPEAFGRDAFGLTVVEGLTVRAMLVEAVRAGLPVESLNRTEIYVDGERLDRETALDHVLAADQVVNVVVEPMGGGGGGRKDIGQILLTVAVIAVSAWVGGGAGGLITNKLLMRAAAAAITLGGQALIAGLYAPDNKPTKANDRYALQSASNQYRQWGPMPLALGEVVTAPDLAAKTFTQSQGDDVWMYGILGLHYGPCEVSEVKIGDTLVSTMGAGDFRMVQHLEPGPRTFQLYPNDVDQLDLGEELQATPHSATPLIRAASSDGSRFDIDFFLPRGLHFQKDDGRVQVARVSVAVRYRPIDQNGAATGPWQTAPGLARSGTTKDPLRITHPVTLPHGRYEFELIRNRPDDDNAKRADTIMVTAIKSVAFRKPVADETLSVIEFAVRATAINQGGLAPITCRIVPKCPTWTGQAWGPAVATSNPAALARWLMTGPAPAKPLLPAQADSRLRAWHQLCDQYDWKCHLYLTESRTQSEALAILERAGRAGVFWDGTQLAASPKVEKPIPVQVFTDSNLKDHRWEIVYSDPVHALRVEFQNIEKGGEPDELFVYNDGYGETADPEKGIEAASLVEAMRLDGQATPNRAYRDGRWALGQRKHQRRIDTWTADIEHLVSQYGSRVRLAWNRANGGSARVRCRRWNAAGTAVVGLRLTAPVEMFEGVSYAVDLRTKGGLYDGVPIQAQPGVTREILFASARHPNLCPAAGDLIAFGEVEKVSEDVEIIAIEPGENLTAVLTGVRYVAPLLMAGETGPIPPLSSKLTGERNANPPRPTLLGVTADAHAVRVSFDMPTWRGAPLSGFSVRWRAKGEDGEVGSWAPLPALDGAARELVAPPLREAPVEGVEATRVEIEITAATVDGRVSPPLQVTVVKPVPSKPQASIWSVDPKEPDVNGVSQPVLIVRGEINDPNVAAVRIAWGLTVDGPWTDAYQGAPLTKALEIGNLTPGVEHHVAITHLSAQGVPSQFLVIGPRVPGQLVAGDTTHLKGEPVQDILDKLSDVETISAANAAAVADLDGRVDDTITAAEAAIAAGEAANLAVLKAGEAGDAAVASNIAAGIATTKADEAGASAQAANAEKLAAQAARDTADQKAQASVLAAAQAEAFAGEAGDWAAASEGSAVQAAASAGEGLSYRNQAVDARDGAVAASQSAGVSASTAQMVSAKLMPDRVSEAANFFNVDAWATPDATTPLVQGVNVSTPDQGVVRQFTGSVPVGSRGWRKIEVGRTYRFTTVSKVVSGALGNQVRNGFGLYDTNGAPVGWWLAFPDRSSATDWITDQREVSGDFLLSTWPNAVYLRPLIHSGLTAGGSALPAVTWAVSTLRAEDVTESVKAASSAAAAQAADARASASAASAQISADLAAKVGLKPNRVVNSDFSNGLANWTPYGGWTTYTHAMFGSLVHSTAGGDVYLVSDWIRVEGGETYTCSAVGDQGPGGNTGGMYFRYRRGDGSEISDGNTFTPTQGIGWQSRIKATFTVPSDCVFVEVIFFRSAAHSYPLHISRVMFSYGTDLVPWNNDAQEAVVAAQLNITAAVAADAADRLASVRFEVTGGAGGAPFQIWGRAGPAGSMAGMVASELALSNVVNGMVVPALKLIGGDAHFGGRVHAGAGKEIIIDPTLPAIITTMGNARMAEGKLPNDNLIYWFGPKQEVVNMRKSNATEWRDASGKAYFAGGISAGQLQASQRTSDQSATVSAQTGRFGSLGGTITVSFSYAAETRVASTSYTPPFPASYEDVSYDPTAQIRLYRSLNGGAFELVATFAATGQRRNWGINGGDYFEEGQEVVCGGSATFVDPDLSTLDRQYRVEMTGRSFTWLNGAGNFRSQFLNVVCVEG